MFNMMGFGAELGATVMLDNPKEHGGRRLFGKKATWMEGLTRDFLTSHLWDVGSKKLSKPGYYEKNYGVPTLHVDMVEHISTLWGGPGKVIDIDLAKMVEKLGTRYRISYDVLRNHKSIRDVLDPSLRWLRYRYYVYVKANAYDKSVDLFKMSVVARPEARPETEVSAEQAEMVRNTWQEVMNEAALDEYNETIGMLDNVLASMVKGMEQIQERGTVATIAAKRGVEKGEVSPTKATFRYTRSGMPLVTLG